MDNNLLALAASVEEATGLALLVSPSIVVRLLFGAEIAGVGMAMSRMAGIALLSLGIACWPIRSAANANSPAFRGMFIYNLLVMIFLFYIGVGTEWVGTLLWPAVVVHTILTLMFAGVWFNNRRRSV